MTTEKYVFNFIVDSKFNGKGFSDIDKAVTKSEKNTQRLNKELNSLSKVTGINKIQSSFNVLNRRISRLNSTFKDVRKELRQMNTSLTEVARKATVWDTQSVHVNSLKRNIQDTTRAVQDYNKATSKVTPPSSTPGGNWTSVHHRVNREGNMGRRNPTGEMLETYQPFIMQNPMVGIYGAMGLGELKDFTFDLGVSEQTNKILMENIGGDYGSFDQITNEQLISIQDLITAMNAQRAIAGLSPEQVNESAPTVAKFGTYAKILTGSDDKANEAMLRLAKGFNGQFAGVDQYGITKESLANTSVGYKKGDDYATYLAAVDEIMGTQMDKLMGTTQGQISTMQKGFRRAGKELTNMIMPVVKVFLQIFNQINSVTHGLPSKILILSGAVLGLTAVFTNAANMMISTMMTIRDIRHRATAWMSGPQPDYEEPFGNELFGKDEKTEYYQRQIDSGALENGKTKADLVNDTKQYYAERHPIRASLEDSLRSSVNSKKNQIKSTPDRVKERMKSSFKEPMDTADRIRGYFGEEPAYDSEKSLRRRNVADLNNLADPTLSLQEKLERVFQKGTAEEVRPDTSNDRFNYDDLSYTTYFKNLKSLWGEGTSTLKNQVASFVTDSKKKISSLTLGDIANYGKGKANSAKDSISDKLYESIGKVRAGIEERANAVIDSTMETLINGYVRYGKYINAFKGAWENVTRGLRVTVKTGFVRLRKEFLYGFNRIKITTQKHLKTLRTMWGNVTDSLTVQLNHAGNEISSAISQIMQDAVPIVVNTKSAINTAIQSIKSSALESAESIKTAIANAIGPENFTVLSEGFNKLFAKARTTITNASNSIQQKITPLFSFLNKNWRSTISNLVDTWKKGINEMKNKIRDTTFGEAYAKGKEKLGGVSSKFTDRFEDKFGDNSFYQKAKQGVGKGKQGFSNFFNEEVGKDSEGNSISRASALKEGLMDIPHGRALMGGGFALNQAGGMVGGTVGGVMEKTGNAMTMAGTGIETAQQVKGFLDEHEQLKTALFDSAKGFGQLLKKGIGGALTTLQETFGLSMMGSVGVLAAGFIAILAVVKVIQHYWDNIVQTVTNFLNWVKGVAVTIFVEPLIPVFEAIDQVWNAIMGIFGTGGSGDILVDLGNTIIALLQPVGSLIMGVAKTFGFLIKIGLTPLVVTLKGVAAGIKGVVDLFKWAVGGLTKLLEPIISAIQGFFEFIAEKAGWLLDALGMNGNGEQNPDMDGDGQPDKDTGATAWAKGLVDERDNPEKYQNKPAEDLDQASLGDLNLENMPETSDAGMELATDNMELSTPEVTMQNEQVEQQQPVMAMPQQTTAPTPTLDSKFDVMKEKANGLRTDMQEKPDSKFNVMKEKVNGLRTDMQEKPNQMAELLPRENEMANQMKGVPQDNLGKVMSQVPQKMGAGKGMFRDDNIVDDAFDTSLDIAGTLVDAIPGGGIISQGIDMYNRKQEMERHDSQKADYLHSLGMQSQDEQDTGIDKLWDNTIGNMMGGADHSKYMRQEKREEEFLNKHGFQSQNQKDNLIDKAWDIGAGIYAGVTSLNPFAGLQAVDDSRRGRHNKREHEEFEQGTNAYQQIANGNTPTPPPNPHEVPKPEISTPQNVDKNMQGRGTSTPITNYLTVNVDNVSDESHIQKMVDEITKVLTFENIKAGRTIGNGEK